MGLIMEEKLKVSRIRILFLQLRHPLDQQGGDCLLQQKTFLLPPCQVPSGRQLPVLITFTDLCPLLMSIFLLLEMFLLQSPIPSLLTVSLQSHPLLTPPLMVSSVFLSSHLPPTTSLPLLSVSFPPKPPPILMRTINTRWTCQLMRRTLTWTSSSSPGWRR